MKKEKGITFTELGEHLENALDKLAERDEQIDMGDFANETLRSTIIPLQTKQTLIQEKEEEREIEHYADFIRAMMDYFVNVNGRELTKHLFDVKIDDWEEDDASGYHRHNFKMMQSELSRFLCKCDDTRLKAIAKQSLKKLKGEK